MKAYPVFIATILFLSVVLTGCPVGTTSPLTEKENADEFDSKLVGTWINSKKDVEASKIRIEKSSNSNSAILIVEEKGSMYMASSDSFEIWCTAIADTKFIVLKELNISAKEPYYIYQFNLKDGNLITHDVSLKNKGIDATKESETFQEEVKYSMKENDFLSEEIVWIKQ